MSTHEHDRAMLEGQEVAASDLYFAARHEMLDTKDRRNVFKAGFERGWRVKEALAQPVAADKFRELLRAEISATIDPSGDIARQEAQIDEADHLLVKFNELFPEAP